MSDEDLLGLTAAERTLRKLADDARADHAAGRRPDDLFECYRLVIDELDRVRGRLHDLEGEGPHGDEPDPIAFYLVTTCGSCDEDVHYGLCVSTLTHRGRPAVSLDMGAQITFNCDECGASTYTGDLDTYVEGGDDEDDPLARSTPEADGDAG